MLVQRLPAAGVCARSGGNWAASGSSFQSAGGVWVGAHWFRRSTTCAEHVRLGPACRQRHRSSGPRRTASCSATSSIGWKILLEHLAGVELFQRG